MARGSDTLMAAPPPVPGGVPMIQCPKCGSAQFFGEKKGTTIGRLLSVMGFIGIIVCIPLMFLIIGFFLIPIPILMLLIGLTRKKYVNRCAKCRRTF